MRVKGGPRSDDPARNTPVRRVLGSRAAMRLRGNALRVGGLLALCGVALPLSVIFAGAGVAAPLLATAVVLGGFVASAVVQWIGC